MLQVTPKDVVIIRSSARRRTIVFETASLGLLKALEEVGQVGLVAGQRYELHVSKLYQFGEIKKQLKEWRCTRPSLPELVAELTHALEKALPHVQGVDTAVFAQWQQTAARGRAGLDQVIYF